MKFSVSTALVASCAIAGSSALAIKERASSLGKRISDGDLAYMKEHGECFFFLNKADGSVPPGSMDQKYTLDVCDAFCPAAEDGFKYSTCKNSAGDGVVSEDQYKELWGEDPPFGHVDGWPYFRSTCDCEAPEGLQENLEKGIEEVTAAIGAAGPTVCAVLKTSAKMGFTLATSVMPAGAVKEAVSWLKRIVNVILKYNEEKPDRVKEWVNDMCGTDDVPDIDYGKLWNYLKTDGAEDTCFLVQEGQCQSIMVPIFTNEEFNAAYALLTAQTQYGKVLEGADLELVNKLLDWYRTHTK